MFCNTYILFFELFMCEVLGLIFYYYKAMTYFVLKFGLGLKTWNRPRFSIVDTPFPLNMVWKDKKWTKFESKWKCKIGTYIVACCAKWLLTKHLKDVHGLVAKRPNLGGLQLLKEVFNIKAMLKWTFTSWEMSWLCKGGMIKRLLVAKMG